MAGKVKEEGHTKGPWISGGWSSNGTPCLGGGYIVATVHTPSYGHGERLKTAEEAVAESKANSALIDSAPALLAALQNMVSALEYALSAMREQDVLRPKCVVTLNAARAALKSATSP